jgi:L-arabinose transport system substrate-binding protein
MDVPYMGISATDIGTKVGEALAAELKKRNWPLEETAAVAVTFDHVNTCRQRTDAAAAALVKAGFPVERIYREPSKQGDVPSAMDAGNILLTKHPEVKRWLVFSSNDEGVLGVVRALESSGRGFNHESVLGIGIGGSTCAAEFKKPNLTGFYATCLISPKRHGYETTEYVYKWIKDGVAPPKHTLTAGILVTRESFDRVCNEEGLAD